MSRLPPPCRASPSSPLCRSPAGVRRRAQPAAVEPVRIYGSGGTISQAVPDDVTARCGADGEREDCVHGLWATGSATSAHDGARAGCDGAVTGTGNAALPRKIPRYEHLVESRRRNAIDRLAPSRSPSVKLLRTFGLLIFRSRFHARRLFAAAACAPARRPKNEPSPSCVPLAYPLPSWAILDAQAPAAYRPSITVPSSRST